MQPRFNEVQGNGKRAVLCGLVKLSFDLAFSRCCFGGSDNHFGFLEFICAHSRDGRAYFEVGVGG